ncbi:efflux RND transporter periplasmic adaptor subunit [Croceiramulus getboli]|nr:efflux RND transporter periplasmic adaptor subunit [Flavobacteriaceae bacterium YJPT1-3]
MKKYFLLFLLTAGLFACGDDKKNATETVIENGDLSAMRTKRSEVVAQREALNEEIAMLDQAIAAKDTNKKLPLVNTITVHDTLFKHYVEIQGSVTTKQNVIVYPEFAGTLTRVYVKEGQRVSKGQILAKIDDGGLSSQLAQLEVQAALAKTTFERQQRLWEQQIGSEIQYLQAKANYEAQQNAVAQLKSQIAKTTVTAPFSGIVDDVITEQGTVVTPGANQLFRIVNLQDMYLEAEVPETYIARVDEGSEVEVYFPVLNKTIASTVRETGNFINPSNRAFGIEVAVPNNDQQIKPNLTAQLRINDYTNTNAILVPQSVISENAEGEQYVFLAEEKESAAGDQTLAVARRVTVTTGKTQGDFVEILTGIPTGARVIKEGARSVKDGQEVEISNQ